MSRIAQLADIIKQSCTEFEEQLKVHKLPTPSFDASYPPVLNLPKEAVATRDAILEAMDELNDLILGPMASIFSNVTNQVAGLTSLHAVSHFKMASSFPSNETATVESIASRCGMDAEDARRILNHALTKRIFSEPSKGVIAHSAASQAIANIPLLAEFIDDACERVLYIGTRIPQAMAKWPGSQELNETAFNLTYETDLPFFPYLSQHPSLTKQFADSMSFFQKGPGMQTELAVKIYDWTTVSTGTVVDIGGSHGSVARALSDRFPAMKCIVQDLPAVINSIPEQDVQTQVLFQSHDFFTEQPVKGADVYFLRLILHNWPDKYCVKILQNLIPALKPGARVVIMDQIIPEPGVLPPYQDRAVRSFDLIMKGLFNSKERSLSAWRELFLSADPRYIITNVMKREDSRLQIMEIQWEV